MPKRTERTLARRIGLAAAGLALLPLFRAVGGCAPAVDRAIADPHARVTHYLDALIADRREVGLQYVAVTEHRVVLDYAGGKADAAGAAPVTPDTTFLTASMTKVLTAAAVLRLVESGKVELDAPLSKYVSEHPYGTGVTLRRLLNHSSGVPKSLQDLLQPRSRLLKDETRRLFFSEQRSASGELDGTEYFSKPGGGPGFGGNLRIYRQRGLATVFLSNRMRVSESEIEEFSDTLDRELLGASL